MSAGLDLSGIKPPRPDQPVYREDCTQCFDSIDDEQGLNVCLHCFNGGCAGPRDHASLHYTRFKHPFALNIQRKRKPRREDDEQGPPQKMSKLAIKAESDEDNYEVTTRLVCYDGSWQDQQPVPPALQQAIEGVMKAQTNAVREEVKAWEQELQACEHTLLVQQDGQAEAGGKSRDLSGCTACDLKENLWLCLTCGNVGCGRKQLGGVSGNNHGLEHSDATGHRVVVKLGSITPEGSADVFCYTCGEERIDPELRQHLAHWNIRLEEQEKTEKSLTELQIEQNLKWDFSLAADGKEAEPMFGPGFSGLKNLGNTCYLASTMQCLFALGAFQDRYFLPDEEPPVTERPAEDLETQMRKMADGLLNGRYAEPPTEQTLSLAGPTDSDPIKTSHRKTLAPTMFKALVGRNHPEFSTMRQQDALEFMQHLFKMVSLSPHKDGQRNPVEAFRFALEQKLQCQDCKRVKYRTDVQDNLSLSVPTRISSQSTAEDPIFEPVTLRGCLDEYTKPETVDMACPACGSTKGFTKRTLFKTFPEVLAVNARRFALRNWVPVKLDIPVEVTGDQVDLGEYLSPGLQSGEEEIQDDDLASAQHQQQTPVDFDPGHVMQIVSMGFSEARAHQALKATQGQEPQPDPAIDWILSHMDEDEPPTAAPAPGPGQSQGANEAQLAQLRDMGIVPAIARQALRETGGDVERAVDWVFSHPDAQGIEEGEGEVGGAAAQVEASTKAVPGSTELPANFLLSSAICHKGTSVHAGHYVSFVLKEVEGSAEPVWVLFNDENVVRATDADEIKKNAYVYFFKRVVPPNAEK
ncbi:hypothetical protein KEM52_001599 [Ascosphaera acerosa]|nr:hypothetical protein KEM52_001599 [Ascosphaera acerosa]